MIWLIFAIFINVYFFITFKLFGKFGLDTFKAITLNYIACFITGCIFFSLNHQIDTIDIPVNFWFWALILGCFFISVFFIMAKTAIDIGVSVSTIASKISMVLPIAYSLFISQKGNYGIWNVLGVLIAFAAIVLTSIKPKDHLEDLPPTKTAFWVMLVFLGAGIVDMLVNHISTIFTFKAADTLVPLFAFGVAAIVGLTTTLVKTKTLSYTKKEVIGGIALGVPNFFSLVVVIRALEAFDYDGAFIFPVLSVATIIGSVFFSILLFKEKLSVMNFVGVFLAFISILLITV